MRRFALSSLVLLIAAGAVAPIANAQTIDSIEDKFDVHAVRLNHLDAQTKTGDPVNFDSDTSFTQQINHYRDMRDKS
ncbi:MAG: hypothetical protein AAFR42_16335 [Cyanobacteria bacterium J06628_6]